MRSFYDGFRDEIEKIAALTVSPGRPWVGAPKSSPVRQARAEHLTRIRSEARQRAAREGTQPQPKTTAKPDVPAPAEPAAPAPAVPPQTWGQRLKGFGAEMLPNIATGLAYSAPSVVASAREKAQAKKQRETARGVTE